MVVRDKVRRWLRDRRMRLRQLVRHSRGARGDILVIRYLVVFLVVRAIFAWIDNLADRGTIHLDSSVPAFVDL